jgi:hypothetical protein
MKFNPDFKEFIELLNAHQVEYMLVGGYAVGFHGYPRYTGDMDFWVAASPQNAPKIIQTLLDFGFSHANLSIQDFLDEEFVFQLGYAPNRIDILTGLSGVIFSDCYKKSLNVHIDNVNVRIIDIESLKTNKRATGRAKDLGDIENLPHTSD